MKKIQYHAGRVLDVLLITLSAFFCIGTIAAQLAGPSPKPTGAHESFDPTLQSVTSVDAAVGYVLGETTLRSPAALAAATDEFVRRRFFHDFSKLRVRDDWLAYLAGFVWGNLRVPVLPDDILRYPQAACSQQSIVFQAIARRLGLDVGSVRLKDHFVAAAKIDGQWQVFDPDREISVRSYPLAALLKADPAVMTAYGAWGRSISLEAQAAHGEIRLTDVNSNPAPNGSLFQRLTHFFSHYGWLLFAALAFARFARPSRVFDRLTPAEVAG